MSEVYSLNQFLQQMKQTGLRLGYQFQVTVDKLDDLQFFATSANLPGRTITAADVPYFGLNFKISTNAEWGGGEWSINARVDNDLIIKKRLESWMNEFADLKKNGGGNHKMTDYKVRIDLLDNTMQKITDTYILVGVFPTSMGELGLDQSAADIVAMDINLAYQYWYNEKDGDPLA